MKMTQPKMRLGAMAAVAVLWLAGCASGVKLDNPAPVETRTPAGVGAGTGNAGAGAGESSVKTVDLGAGATLPAGVGRVVYFDFDSFVVKDEFRGVVESHAKFLGANRAKRILVEGHTDERGGREYNLALGQKRAEAVRRAMGLLGVPDSQLEAVSFGKEKPAVMGSTEDAFAKNRRAEISYR